MLTDGRLSWKLLKKAMPQQGVLSLYRSIDELIRGIDANMWMLGDSTLTSQHVLRHADTVNSMKTVQITVKMFYDDRDLTPPLFSTYIRIGDNGAYCNNVLHSKCITFLCVCLCVCGEGVWSHAAV